MKKVKRKRIPPSTNKLFPILILVATIFMSVGYASINSIIMNINGEAVAKAQDGIYITEVSYVSDVNANLDESKINIVYGTNLNSSVSLSDIDPKSSITYAITIYNSTDTDYYFYNVDYLIGDNTYSNGQITFEITGIANNQELTSKNYITFTLTFSYSNGILPNDNKLNSILNFKFVTLEDKVTVYLDANGGLVNESTLNVYAGNVYDDLPTPTYENYSFVGWYNAKIGGTKYDSNKVVSSDDNLITLYARWSAKPIAINNIPTVNMTQDDAKEYYGQIVSNINGSTFNPNPSDLRTWRVFYIDTENKYGDGKGTIYLKADEVSSKTLRFSTSYDSTNLSGYDSVFDTLSNTRYYKILNDNVVNSNGVIINTSYLKLNPSYSNGRKNISSTLFYENEKAAAYLSDHTQFTSYTDSRTNYAVGSPSVEMWIDSWNSVYGNNYKFYYQYNVNVDGTTGAQKLPGYQLKVNNDSWGQAGGADIIDINSIDTTLMYKTNIGIWFASPAIVYGGGSLIRLSPSGFIGNSTINASYGFSPVVSLNSESLVYTTSYVE